MVKEEIGRGVGLLALVSVLAIMIILLAVLALVVVQTLAQSPWGVFTIAVTIPIALIMGIALRTGKVSVLAVTIFADAAVDRAAEINGLGHDQNILIAQPACKAVH